MTRGSWLISTICPGDFVFVSYDDYAVIEDMQCGPLFESAVRDNAIGGRNDWTIDQVHKYESGGFMVKARRKLRTNDKFDWQLDGEPLKVLFGVHNSSWTLEPPTATGFRGFKKYSAFNEDI